MLLKLEEGQISAALQDLERNIETGEIVLDFRAVHRMDSSALRALEELAKKAAEKQAFVVLRAVNVDLYRAIKLMKPAARFSFEAPGCA